MAHIPEGGPYFIMGHGAPSPVLDGDDLLREPDEVLACEGFGHDNFFLDWAMYICV